jgi:WD40 repeat protein
MHPATMPTVQPLAVFGEPQLHTDGDLLALAFAPDGELRSVEDPGVLRRWHGQTGKQIDWQCLSELETVWAFSRDARLLASGNDDELTLWDAATAELLAAVEQSTWVTALDFASDGAALATGHDDGSTRLWKIDGQELKLIRQWHLHPSAVSAVALSRDGKLLASAGEDKTISIMETATGIHVGVCQGHTDRIPALAWHPKGRFLVSAGWDTTARIWHAGSQQPIVLLNDHAAQVTALTFSPDGSRLATADSSASMHVWDFAPLKKLRRINGVSSDISCLAFSADGSRLAGGGGTKIHVWDATTGNVLVGGGSRPLTRTSLAVSADNSLLVTNTGGAQPQVWNLATGQLQATLPSEQPVHALAFPPHGHYIAGAAEKAMRIWHAQTGQVADDCDGPEEIVTTLAASPDGQLVATGSSTGTDVWLWRLTDFRSILLIPDPLYNCTIESLAFHPASRHLAIGGIDWLATGGSSGGVSIWDLHERCEVAVFPGGATCVAFHPDGRRVAVATIEQSVTLWDFPTQEFDGELTGHDGAVNCLAYSPDGQWLATSGEDRTLRFWDAEGQERALHELDSQITALAFSPDGRFLFVAHANTSCSQFLVSDLIG